MIVDINYCLEKGTHVIVELPSAEAVFTRSFIQCFALVQHTGFGYRIK